MNKLYLPNYNIHWTLLGGQSHNWSFDGEYFWGHTTKRLLQIKRDGEFIFWQTYPQKDDFEYLSNYLRLDADYEKIISIISKDNHIITAIGKYPSLRLLRQDFTETLISYIFSANNNLPSIRNSIQKLREAYGEKIVVEGKSFYLFPTIKALENINEADLRKTKMGFRAKYLINIIEELKNGLTDEIIKMDEQPARERLLKIKGVGEKISDCVLGYGLDFENVTPFDVWGKRIVTDLYGQKTQTKYNDMRIWSQNYFGGYAGWAGQFLYEYIRNLAN